MMDSEERQRFADAVRVANIPTLLMVLVQLSGELRWLKPPYRPAPARGMGDNDTGGLPEQIPDGRESLGHAHPTGLRRDTIDGLARSRTATMPSVVELCLSQGGLRGSHDIG
jgi:hypothetical protein